MDQEHFHTKKSQGFTLIELLVVIAIIGILSAIVLNNLSAARQRAKDASAQETMNSVRSAAELYYSSAGNNTYGTASVADGIVNGTTGNITNMSGFCADATTTPLLIAVASSTGTDVHCSVGFPTSYQVNTTLSAGQIFCIDGNGFAGTPTTTPTV